MCVRRFCDLVRHNAFGYLSLFLSLSLSLLFCGCLCVSSSFRLGFDIVQHAYCIYLFCLPSPYLVGRCRPFLFLFLNIVIIMVLIVVRICLFSFGILYFFFQFLVWNVCILCRLPNRLYVWCFMCLWCCFQCVFICRFICRYLSLFGCECAMYFGQCLHVNSLEISTD